MNKRIKILTIVIILLGLVYGQRTIIHAGTLLDGKSKRVLKNQAIIIENGIKSGLSYSGARTIRELQAKARFIRQTTAGATESSTHILLK